MTLPDPKSFSHRIASAGTGLRSASALVGGAARRAGLGRAARSAPLALIFVTAATLTAEAKRVALVVGNAAYDNVYALKNATNDASDLAAALERLDFEVTLLTDASEADFWARLDSFADSAEGAESAMFFFSGHAFQLSGANYLVPTDATLASKEAIENETWRLDEIVKRLAAKNRQTLIFLDACRNNPLPENLRSGSDGLAQMEKGSGTFVAFATQPNNVTSDGAGENSPFTQALLNHIEEPGISVSDLMIRVRNDVESETFGRQTPWDQSSLRAQFYFNPQVEKTAELTDADYELIAALDPETRKRLLAALGNSGTNIVIEEVEEEVEEIVEAVAIVDIVDVPDDDTPVETPDKASGETVVASNDAETAAGGESAVVIIGGDQAPERVTGSESEKAGSTTGAETVVASNEAERAEGTNGAERVTGTEVAGAERVTGSEVQGTEVAGAERVTGSEVEGTEVAGAERVTGTEVTGAEVTGTEVAGAVPPDPNASRTKVIGPDGEEREAVILAGLAPTRSLEPTTAEPRSRVIGQEIDRDSDAAREAGVAPTAPELAGKELASAVQTELSRLGCYRMNIDGDWGKGSRVSLFRYYAARKIASDQLEPSNSLLRRLQSDDEVACKAVQQVASKKASKAITKVRTAAATKRAATPTKAAAKSTGKKRIQGNTTTVRTKSGGTKKTVTKKLRAGVFR
ncbi:caspase family protein [Vannielia litorea]|uniref:caspase family protein n=1 Tax=Vannielia litorea TaxID=1217970 RepID=UPI001C9824B8|nr:caspase family protein [Vannielia litorea]MBY6153329.1 caspase family protein [Vannielia litorea]